MYNPEEECKAMLDTLKKICEERNVSVYALSKESGIAKSTISYLMNGKTNPRMYTILALCDALGVTIRALFEERFSDEEVTSYMKEMGTEQEEEMLLQLYHKLPEEKRKLLKIFLEMLFQYKCGVL